MAGDDDPKSPAHEDDNDDDLFYDLYDDEFGPFTEEDLLNVMSDYNPNLMDLSFTNANQNPPPPPPPPPPPLPLPPPHPPPPPPPPPIPPPLPQDSNLEINETQMLQELALENPSGETNNEFDSFDDDLTFSWDMFESLSDDLNNNNVPGETDNDNGDGNNVGETGRLEVSTRDFGENRMNFEIGGTSTMPVPVTPTISDGIFLCTCCHPLRGIVHTNGPEVMKLDIYGEIGYFCHAILETQPFADSNERRYQTIHFKDLKMEDVHKFIENYFTERDVSGFRLVQDTNAAFYQAMNSWSINNQPPPLTMPPPSDVPISLAMPDETLNVPPVPLYVGLRDEPPRPLKERARRNTPLSVQRERTGKLTLKDIGIHFHLPIEEAARKMELCPTVLKKVCRKGGLSRWPHRKIKSIERKISALRRVVDTAKDPDVKAHAEKEIEKLQKQINNICSEVLEKSKEP